MSLDARIRRLPAGARALFLEAADDWLDQLEAAARKRARFQLTDAKGNARIAHMDVPEPGEPLIALGKLSVVSYDGDHNGQPHRWVHPFERPKPVLASSLRGRLFIVGGRYRVTDRGIVG